MNNNGAMAELLAAVAGIVILSAVFSWFALLPAIGVLWLIGWL